MTSTRLLADMIYRSLLEMVENPGEAIFDDGAVLQTVRHIFEQPDAGYECAIVLAGLADTAAVLLSEFIPRETVRARLHELIIGNAISGHPDDAEGEAQQ